MTTLDLITAQMPAATTLVGRTDRCGAPLTITTARPVWLTLPLALPASSRRVLDRPATPTLGLRLAIATASAHR
ncbi:MAG: hypothetical protein EBY44_08975 [Actinobacteria bacterium]|nr:hypothetical protein [Actinomycetota bacterium]